MAFLLVTSVFAFVPVFSLQSPVDVTMYYVAREHALQNIDLDVTSTITPVVSYSTVLVYKNAMRRGYMGGGVGNASAAKQIFDLHVKRTDAVAGLVAAVIGLKRTNLTNSPAETFAYPNSTFVLLGPSPDPGITVRLIHYETGSSTTGILPAGATGVTWQMAARTDVITFDCQDTNPSNNYVSDGTVTAYANTFTDFDFNHDGIINIYDYYIFANIFDKLFLGDINGDGIVDILDAIALAGVYGKIAGQTGYNADANVNPLPDGDTGKQMVDMFDALILATRFGRHLQP
jgi:hypothetical protein